MQSSNGNYLTRSHDLCHSDEDNTLINWDVRSRWVDEFMAGQRWSYWTNGSIGSSPCFLNIWFRHWTSLRASGGALCWDSRVRSMWLSWKMLVSLRLTQTEILMACLLLFLKCFYIFREEKIIRIQVQVNESHTDDREMTQGAERKCVAPTPQGCDHVKDLLSRFLNMYYISRKCWRSVLNLFPSFERGNSDCT